MGCGTALAAAHYPPHGQTSQDQAASGTPPRTPLESERKQVTVLFADLADSTEIIGNLDSEDAQRLLDGAIAVMMDAVRRYGGTVTQTRGDSIVALFGAPVAHEDHTVRACYASLAMQQAIHAHADEQASDQRNLAIRLRNPARRRDAGGGVRPRYRSDEAIALIEAPLAEVRSRTHNSRPTMVQLSAVAAFLAAGRLDEAAELVHETIALALQLKARDFQADALRLAGDVAAAAGDGQAIGYYRDSLALADELGMRPIVAHCHLGTGKLLLRRGERESACTELTAAVTLFREMAMPHWLAEAEAALAEISG